MSNTPRRMRDISGRIHDERIGCRAMRCKPIDPDLFDDCSDGHIEYVRETTFGVMPTEKLNRVHWPAPSYLCRCLKCGCLIEETYHELCFPDKVAKMSKQYLGDAVYVEMEGDERMKLTTSDGIRDTNTIILEPEVVGNFMNWMLPRFADPEYILSRLEQMRKPNHGVTDFAGAGPRCKRCHRVIVGRHFCTGGKP